MPDDANREREAGEQERRTHSEPNRDRFPFRRLRVRRCLGLIRVDLDRHQRTGNGLLNGLG